MDTATEILKEYSQEELQDAMKLIESFAAEMLAHHQSVEGEAWPEDRTRYCLVCTSEDGGMARWPCKTLRAMKKLLYPHKTARKVRLV